MTRPLPYISQYLDYVKLAPLSWCSKVYSTEMQFTIHADGGARGNPGPAGASNKKQGVFQTTQF